MSSRTLPQRLPVYYGWVNVLMAAVAMIATFPGRTFGLGMIQKKLLEDLRISELEFTGITKNRRKSSVGRGMMRRGDAGVRSGVRSRGPW